MPFRSSGACCPAAAAIPGPLRVRQGSGAAVRAALGGFAASFGQQRGGFVAAAWGARGGFLRATAFGMRGAERAPHLGTRPQKTATLRASAGVCLRFVGRCARPTPRQPPALSLPPVLRPASACGPDRASHQHCARASGYGTCATWPGTTWLAGRSAPTALPPAAMPCPPTSLRQPSPLARAQCCAAATKPPRCAPKVAANSPSAARARARSAHRPRSGPEMAAAAGQQAPDGRKGMAGACVFHVEHRAHLEAAAGQRPGRPTPPQNTTRTYMRLAIE